MAAYGVLSFHMRWLRANLHECGCQEASLSLSPSFSFSLPLSSSLSHTHARAVYTHPEAQSLCDGCHMSQEAIMLRSMKPGDRCQGDERPSAKQMTE